MPTYEYQCTKCDHRFEELQSIMAKPLTRCPQCRGKLRRVIHGGAALVFKGPGFYSTDYRSGGSSSSPKPKKETPCGSDAPCKKGACESGD